MELLKLSGVGEVEMQGYQVRCQSQSLVFILLKLKVSDVETVSGGFGVGLGEDEDGIVEQHGHVTRPKTKGPFPTHLRIRFVWRCHL